MTCRYDAKNVLMHQLQSIQIPTSTYAQAINRQAGILSTPLSQSSSRCVKEPVRLCQVFSLVPCKFLELFTTSTGPTKDQHFLTQPFCKAIDTYLR